MARILSYGLIHEKNRLESDHVWTMLFEVQIPGAPTVFRLANYDQDVMFHGFVFTQFAVQVDNLEDATTASLVHLRLSIQNVDQQLISLFENYWVTVASPKWQVTIWSIDTQTPNETPFGTGEIYTMTQAQTNLRDAVVELQAEGITLSKVVPGRRFTVSSGFSNIPRR